ncbi:MAG: T6SS immunity protein Tdi1 domain-containing protein [Sphingomonadaceae bacterium]
MNIAWRDLAFELEPEMAQEAAKAWSWLVPEPWVPVICSMVGGVFLQSPDGNVLWLDTATGLIEQAAQSREQFDETCRSSSELVAEWFLPALVERLHAAGKIPHHGQCYGFAILPIFVEGKYDAENLFVISVREQIIGMADIHRQLHDLPDGSKVRLSVTD